MEPETIYYTTSEERLAASDIENASNYMKPFLTPDTDIFKPLRIPNNGDWLSEHPEKPKSFVEFQKECAARKQKAENKAICLLPLGEFDTHAPSLEILKEYAEIYFGKEVKVMKPWKIEMDSKDKGHCNLIVGKKQFKIKCRSNYFDDEVQLLTKDILNALKTIIAKISVFCIMAFTMYDVYPNEDWNYVFGQAFSKTCVGIFSFARFSPTFDTGEIPDTSQKKLLLWRALKVMTHEIGHLFSISHCCYYECLMNGVNSIEENDKSPSHLCPVCLRKLHYMVGFNMEERYKKLLSFFEKYELKKDSDWIKNNWIK